MRTLTFLSACISVVVTASSAVAADAKPVKDNIKEIAGTSEFLRSVPKKFATLQAVDTTRQRVTLLMEGEKAAK